MSQVTQCLRDALAVIEQSDELDDQSKQVIREPFERIIASNRTTDAEKLDRIAQQITDARAEAYAQKVAQLRHKAKKTAIEDWDGDDLRRAVSPKPGNRGSPTEASLTSQFHSELRVAGAQLNSVFDTVADTRFGLIRDSEQANEFVRAAVGMDTDNQTAADAAREYQRIMDEWADRLLQAGVWINKREHYFPQSHDLLTIQGQEGEWRDYLRTHLDPEMHPDPDGAADAIMASITEISYDTSPAGAISSLGRKIHFQTPEAEAEYFFRYGKGSVTTTAYQALQNRIRNVLLAEKFGPRAVKLVEEKAASIEQNNIIAQSGATKKEIKAKDRDTRQARRAQHIMVELSGAGDQPANISAANWTAAAREMTSALMLGKVVLYTPTDFFAGASTARFHRGGTGAGSFMAGTWDSIRSGFALLNNREARKLVRDMGLWRTAVQANAVSRLGSAYDMNNPLTLEKGRLNRPSDKALAVSSQLSSFTQRVTGAQAAEEAVRAAQGLMVMRAMRQQTRRSWDELSEVYQRVVLRQNGITRADWERIRAQAGEVKGTGAINTHMIEDRALRGKVNAAIVRETEIGVVLPNAADRRILTFGTQAGTLPGELIAMLTQFLSWPIAFFRNNFSREVGKGHSGMVMFLGGMVASSALTLQLSQLASGQPTYDWDDPVFWLRSFARSGVGTPLWPLIAGVFNGEGFSAILDAPLLDLTGGTLVGLGSAIQNGAIEGDISEAMADLVRTAEDMAPNWWFIEPFLGQVFDAALWHLDPEYMARQQAEQMQRKAG